MPYYHPVDKLKESFLNNFALRLLYIAENHEVRLQFISSVMSEDTREALAEKVYFVLEKFFMECFHVEKIESSPATKALTNELSNLVTNNPHLYSLACTFVNNLQSFVFVSFNNTLALLIEHESARKLRKIFYKSKRKFVKAEVQIVISHYV
jgi:hypothetical protein